MIESAVHISHEVVRKVGGIGAVLHGLISNDVYVGRFKETLLYGPLFDRSDFFDPANGIEPLFSSDDGIMKSKVSEELLDMERRYGVKLFHGKKTITDEFDPTKKNEVDIVAVEVGGIYTDRVNEFKYRMWEHYSIDSMRYESSYDYEQYVRLAVPYLDLLRLFFREREVVHFGHEYMGVPALLAVDIARNSGERVGDVTVFYAHEISPARNVVESIPGHDVAFYNLLKMDVKSGKSFEEEFGDLSWHYRSVLIKREGAFDYIFAVGDFVAEEYRFLVPSVDRRKLKIVYNGIPIRKITLEDRKGGRERIEKFCENTLGMRPDLIFTHVARLVVSKGIWRDFKVLYHLDTLLKEAGLKACYILLSSLIVTGRSPDDVKVMEGYGWPVVHRKGWPDLVDTEVITYDALQNLNMVTTNVKGIFINQFGFSRELIGKSVPEGTTFLDLRMASDLEFGQSIYEPFGIAPLEVLPFGGLAVLSSSAGATSFLREKLPDRPFYHVFDYIELPGDLKSRYDSREKLKGMSITERDLIEDRVVKENVIPLYKMLLQRKKAGDELLLSQQSEVTRLGWEEITAYIVDILK